MRRTLSISLILLFWLAPLAVLLPASSETRLPLCCRRNGVHHCMSAAEAAGPGHSIGAPARCPCFPAAAPATISPQFALAPATADLEPPAAQHLSLAQVRTRGVSRAIRNVQGRAPPSGDIA